jgi:uncharacterized membrane protein YphA (DoxX/SURF4 family)
MSRYYPGFLAAFFIVLLRIAIGWHFLNEGLEKVESTYGGGKEPFSAEIYLRNANGPFGPYFRQMIPDVDGLDRLDPDKTKASWSAEVARISGHYAFNDDQKKKAEAILDENLQWVTYWFQDPPNAEKVKKYQHDLDEANRTESDPQSLSFQKERALDSRRSLEADRRALLAPLLDHEKALREAVINKVATPEQAQSLGAPSAPRNGLEMINNLTMFGLVAIGGCLILGFLTPLAALLAATFLAMIYFSMPPWPGLPPNPRTEGHYFIVSKNLVEMLACLVLATTPSGHWIGLDALFFGARRRRRLAPEIVHQPEHETAPVRATTARHEDQQPIPID